MCEAGYGSSSGAEQTRLRRHATLEEFASRPEVQSMKDDLVAATRWILKAGEALGRSRPRGTFVGVRRVTFTKAD